MPQQQNAASSPTRKVAVIGTGGTISTEARADLASYEYADFGRRMDVDELLATLRVQELGVEVLPVRFSAVSSSSLTPRDWIRLARKIGQVAHGVPDLSGIVITHGTASLEETAYFLHLTVSTQLPVILVGAQRARNVEGSDAVVNLLNAIRVAAASAARDLGILVMLNDEIHSAREVTKVSNWRLNAFRTADFGPLGTADPDAKVSFYRKPTRRHAPDTEFNVEALEDLPRVDIVYSYAGADGALISAAVDAGAQGIVVAGNAPGRPTSLQRDALIQAAAKGVVVVLSSRSGSGRVIPRIKDRQPGFVSADNLNPQKARVLTMLALTVTTDPGNIQRMFEEY